MMLANRSFAVLLAVVAAAFALPAAAQAHAEISGGPLARGGAATVHLALEHGCSGEGASLAAVNRVDLLVPAGFSRVVPRPVGGWRSNVSSTSLGTVIRWNRTRAGALASDFPIFLVAPRKAGRFGLPVVQHCGSASLHWTQKGYQPEYPLPYLRVR